MTDSATEKKITVRILQPHMLSEVLRFGSTAFANSNMAPLGYNSVIARKTLRNVMGDPTMRAFTAWIGDKCCGVIIGMLAPMPWCGGLCATDLVFAADAGGDLLLDKFIGWAKENKVVRIDMAVSDSGVRAGYDRLFSSRGMARASGVYYWQVEGPR